MLFLPILEIPKLSKLCKVVLCLVKLIQTKKRKVAFTCLDFVDGLGTKGFSGMSWTEQSLDEFIHQRFHRWFLRIVDSNYVYSHHKKKENGNTKGESKTKLLIHSATFHSHPVLFYRAKDPPVTFQWWGGNIHRDEVFWDSWASAVWIWNWLCGKIVSLLQHEHTRWAPDQF